MMKRSLIFVLIAVLSAIFVLTGCPTDGGGDDGGGTPPVNPDTGVAIDHTSTINKLQEDLLDTTHPEWQVIGVDIANVSAFNNENTVIPVGKTLVLQNTGAPDNVASIESKGLIVEGTLIVSNYTGISAIAAGKLFVGREGRVEVQRGGTLETDDRKSVTNFVGDSVSVASALTTKVSFKGGSTLSIGEAFTALTDIETLLTHISPGSVALAANVDIPPSTLELTARQPFKPSEIITISGISAVRKLAAIASGLETATELTIPAGAAITATEALDTVITITVEGGAALTPKPEDTLKALKTLTVGGELNAPAATGDTGGVLITVTKGGTLQVGTIKVGDGSLVSNGGTFKGATDKPLPNEDGAIINGSVSDGTAIESRTGLGSGDALSVEAGKTVQLTGAGPFIATSITVAADAKLLIPAGVTLTIGNGGSSAPSVNIAGAIKVESGGVLVTNWGTATASSTPVLTGTLEFLSGSELRDLKSGGGSLWSTATTNPPPAEGSYIFHAGAKAFNGASPAGPTVGAEDDTALITLSSGALTLKKTEYVLAGNASIKGGFAIVPGDTLTISKDSVLTVNATGTDTTTGFSILGTVNLSGKIVGGDSSKKLFVPYGTVDSVECKGVINVTPDGTNNFYDNAGTQLLQSPIQRGANVGQATFTWDDTLKGWKAGS